MGNQRKRRAARRRLKAHERGDDRHTKSAAYRNKVHRLRAERDKRRPATSTPASKDEA